MPLPKVKDPLITELKTICESRLAIPTKFVEANLAEANFGLDQLLPTDFPCLVYITSKGSDNEIVEAGEIHRRAQVNALLLNSVPSATSDISSGEVNDYIYQMYQLSQNLMYWINKSTLSVNGGVDKWKSDSLFEQFDAQLFGQGLTFEWRIRTGTTGYYNAPGIV